MSALSVTVIMKTYGNHDFTNAASWALRQFYPGIQIIYADGHPQTPYGALDLVWIPGAPCETCQNAAMTLVETDFVLLMDNDTRVLHEDAIPLCLEALQRWPDVAASGWYGFIEVDPETFTAYVGTEYTDHLELSATQAAFSIHRVSAYRDVGGMPIEPYWDVPKHLWKEKRWTPGYAGDLTICKRYRAAGYRIVSPKRTVPILHWGMAIEHLEGSKGKQPFEQWWYSETNHIRVNPLNNWRSYAESRSLPRSNP